MPKKFRDYLFKMKNPHSRPQIRLPFNSLLSGCKHPRTPSFALYVDRNQINNHVSNQKDDAATLADIDRFLLENFKSLYLKDTEEETTTENTKTVLFQEQAPKLGSLLYNDPPMPRHLRESTRFFVKPGFSGSLVEEASTTSDEVGSVSTINDVSSSSNSYNEKEAVVEHALPDNSIVLLTHSTSPYEDFKRSMQEMVNNHERVVDWDFMEELLFCYLNVNEKKSHKFILSAFVDLINVMRRNDVSDNTDSPKPRSVRTVRTGRELRNNLTKNFTLEFGSS